MVKGYNSISNSVVTTLNWLPASTAIGRRFLRNWRSWLYYFAKSGSLSPPQQTEAKSLLEVTGELFGLRVANLNESSSTLKGRNLGLEPTIRNCSDSERQSIFNLSQATARIEKEVLSNQFAGTSDGQCCLKHLRKSLSDKISKFELKFNHNAQLLLHLHLLDPLNPKELLLH